MTFIWNARETVQENLHLRKILTSNATIYELSDKRLKVRDAVRHSEFTVSVNAERVSRSIPGRCIVLYLTIKTY